jgi:hypothetical protein
MSALEAEQTPTRAAAKRPRGRLRRLGRMLLVFAAQYIIVALLVGLSVAATLRYFVTPQIVARFEAIATALRR